MKYQVLLSTSYLTMEEVQQMNMEKDEIEFSLVQTDNFLPSPVVLILVKLGESLALSAAYDVLKDILNKVLEKLSLKKIPKSSTIEMVCGDKKISISANFPISEQQKEKLIDAAIEKFREI